MEIFIQSFPWQGLGRIALSRLIYQEVRIAEVANW